MTSAILIALLITAVLPSLIRFYRLESNNQGSVTGSKLREIKRWLQYHSPEKKKIRTSKIFNKRENFDV